MTVRINTGGNKIIIQNDDPPRELTNDEKKEIHAIYVKLGNEKSVLPKPLYIIKEPVFIPNPEGNFEKFFKYILQKIGFRNNQKICVHCNDGEGVVYILYGEDYNTDDKRLNKDFILGGKFIYDDSPAYLCKKCKNKFGNYLEEEPKTGHITLKIKIKQKTCKHEKKDVIPIIYGLPSDGMIKRDGSDIKLGGCIVPENPPAFYCKRCKTEFGNKSRKS